MEFSAKQIAEYIQGVIEGDENATVHTFAKIEEGIPGAISFLSNPKYTHYIYDTQSSIVLVNKDFAPEKEVKATLIRVDNAYESLAKLLNLYEQWKGRIFKCEGMVTDVFEEECLQYIVMDVGTDGFQKLVVLINRSARTDIIPGVRYSAYADVEGRELYYAAYCPLLNMRYVYDAK